MTILLWDEPRCGRFIRIYDPTQILKYKKPFPIKDLSNFMFNEIIRCS